MSTHPDWLNSAMLENTLKKYLKDDHLKLIATKTKDALAAGENFASDMYRTIVDYTTGGGVREKMTLVVKLVPDEGFKKNLSLQLLSFEREMRMYRDILPKLNKNLGDSRALSAQCLYADTKSHNIIIMEDLSLFGFKAANRQNGFDLEHSLMVMEYLAKLHASSLLLHKENPEIMDFYDIGLFNDQNGKEFCKTFVGKGFKALLLAVEQWAGFELYAEKLKKLLPHIVQKTVALTKRDADGFNVLCHGDTWCNNMMFKYDEDKNTPVQLKFVDFQLSVFTSPAIDLHYFLFTSPSEEVRIYKMDQLLTHYHSHLLKTIVQLGHSPVEFKVPTYDQFIDEFNKKGFYGVVASAVIMPIARAPSHADASIEPILAEGEVDKSFVDFVYNTPSYKQSMIQLLPYFDKLGYLD